MPFDLTALWPDVWLPFVWGTLVGLVFSLVGAAGGILASFGLISVLGLTDANQVKPMAQVLTLATPLVAVPSYLRQCRVVLWLAVILASGGWGTSVILRNLIWSGRTTISRRISPLSNGSPWRNLSR